MPADDPTTPKIPLVFYRTAGGNEPVRDWLRAMDRTDRLEIGADLQRVQYRWPVGMPLCRALGHGLWELRTELSGRTISRVFIGFHRGTLYALHAFIKKTQRTPDRELAIARRRKQEVENG